MFLMTWNSVGNYLNKFKKLKPPKDFLKEQTVLVIKKILDIDLEPEDIDCRGATLFIKTKNASLKNAIFLNKEKILEKLSEKLGPKSPRDIRF